MEDERRRHRGVRGTRHRGRLIAAIGPGPVSAGGYANQLSPLIRRRRRRTGLRIRVPNSFRRPSSSVTATGTSSRLRQRRAHLASGCEFAGGSNHSTPIGNPIARGQRRNFSPPALATWAKPPAPAAPSAPAPPAAAGAPAPVPGPPAPTVVPERAGCTTANTITALRSWTMAASHHCSRVGCLATLLASYAAHRQR